MVDVTAVFQAPNDLQGLYVELNDGSVYHLVDGDEQGIASEIRDAISGLDVQASPSVSLGEAVSEVNVLSERLSELGYDNVELSESDILGAQAFIDRAEELERNALADEFAQTVLSQN